METPGADISATGAWDVFTGSSDVVIGVIDTGIDYLHPDLAANIWVNEGEIPDNGLDDDGNGYVDDVHGWDSGNDDGDPMDDHGHGTHVAGTIGAIGNNGTGVVGVSWNVRIAALKFLSSGGNGSTSDAIVCVEYATSMGFRVTNNSWGGTSYSQALRDAIESAGDAGGLFVASAGNSSVNVDLHPHYPAAYSLPNIISVASTTDDDVLSSFSNWGPVSVDLAAPGSEVYSTLPNEEYGYKNGTSMAAPHVSGTLALLFDQQPGVTATAAKGLILGSTDPLPSLEGLILTGGRLNAFNAIAEPDSISPSAIQDLAIIESEGTWVRLSWSATGDDSTSGSASSYEIRHSLAPIDEVNFESATLVLDPPDPAPSGSLEETIVGGLEFSSEYWFAIRALDEYGNASPISNVPTTTTLAPPEISVSPVSLSADLVTGGTAEETLTISNGGTAELNFDISVLPSLFDRGEGGTADSLRILIVESGGEYTGSIRPALLAFPEIIEVSVFDGGAATPGAEELRGYDAVILMNSSPFHELMGDRLADYADAGGCVVLTLGAFYEDIALGGRFADDGYSPFVAATGIAGPVNLESFNPIHPIMEGVSHAFGTNVGVPTLAAHATSIATWSYGLPFLAITGENVIGANVLLTWDEWDGDVPLILRNAVLWGSRGLHWLRTHPASGTVASGGSVDVDVTFDAAEMTGGTHELEIVVSSDDPMDPFTTILAHLHVTGAPDISVSPLLLDFGTVFVTSSDSLPVTVANLGSEPLQVSASTQPTEYSVFPDTFSLVPFEQRELVVEFAPSSEQSFVGTLRLESDDPDEAEIEVSLSGDGLNPPDIVISPDSLEADLFTGEFTIRTLTIENQGLSDLIWDAAPFPPAVSRVLGRSPVLRTPRIYSAATEDSMGAGPRTLWTAPLPEIRGTPAGDHPPLEDVLALLNNHHAIITDQIPNRFDFSEGETGDHIVDGGENMYDVGNYLNTPLGDFIDYSNDAIVNEDEFGPSGRFFTRKYPGLFVCVADLDAIDWFRIRGGLGQDGAGSVDGSTLQVSSSSGQDYLGFVKRVYGVQNPSVNHLMIVESGPSISHNFSFDTNVDLHTVTGLTDTGRIYYLLYAGTSGHYIDDQATLDIMEAFLGTAVAPSWLGVEPRSGVLTPGGASDLDVSLDADGLYGGSHEGRILLASNDPDTPESWVPVTLQVTGAPDLELSSGFVDFGTVFIDTEQVDTLSVHNGGTDVLEITSLVTTGDGFAASLSSFVLDPGDTQELIVSFSPQLPVGYSGSITIESNDPDEPTVVIPLTGTGLEPPEVAVQPDSLGAALFVGESVDLDLTLYNTGLSDLVWELVPAFLPIQGVLARAGPFSLQLQAPKEADWTSIDESRHVWTGPPVRLLDGTSSPSSFTELEDILESLNENHGSITDLIPNRYDFTEGETSNYIVDGGDDMYDGGNYLNTNFWSFIDYSNDAVIPGTEFGPQGRYFTRKYEGLWVMAADLDEVEFFKIRGGLGADGDGSVDGSVLQANFGDQSYLGFVKRVYDAGDPSVNHLIIVPAWVGLEHSFSMNTNVDLHEVTGLIDTERIYYLLYAGTDGHYIDDSATLEIMEAFLQNSGLAPQWVTTEPGSGVTSPGDTTRITVSLGAADLLGGDHEAQLLVQSNDPVLPELAVPISLSVTGAPDIVMSDFHVDFDSVFVGFDDTATLTVQNVGTDVLEVSGSTSHPDFLMSPPQFDLTPGTSLELTLTFAPQEAGSVEGDLTLTTNDPDEPTLVVSLEGQGIDPPDIVLEPTSLSVDLFVGEATTRWLSLGNAGMTSLLWQVHPIPRVDPGPPWLDTDDAPLSETGRAARGEVPPPSLETILDALNARHPAITATIPNRFDFSEGVTGNSIVNGGNDMYNTGNYLNSDEEEFIPYRDNVVWTSDDFGPGSRYFTRKVQGLFVCAVDLVETPFFKIRGGLGADSEADVTGAVLQASYEGTDYLGFVKRVFGAETPSVNHLMIVEKRPTIDHSFSTWPLVDLHTIEGLSESKRIYYLLYAGADGAYLDNTVALQVMETFLSHVLTPTWIGVDPNAGTTAPDSTDSLTVTFDAHDLLGGEYEADLVFTSNDPDEQTVLVPALLHVTGIPELVLSREELDFGSHFVGAAIAETLVVSNPGTDHLSASLSVTLADFEVSPTSFSLPPGDSSAVVVTFRPGSVGPIGDDLTISSNDPDRPEIMFPLFGTGLDPPVFTVSPDSLVQELFDEQHVVDTLTIVNTGLGDLEWSASVWFEDPFPPGLSGLHVLFDRSHNEPSSASRSALISDITSRGALLTESFEAVSADYLRHFDVLWVADGYNWSQEEAVAVAEWVSEGGSLLLEGDLGFTVPSYNLLLSTMQAGIEYSYGSAVSGPTQNVHEHPSTEGVETIQLGDARSTLSQIEDPGGRLVDDAQGTPVVAYSEVGNGRIVACSEQIFANGLINAADNRSFGNRVFGWFQRSDWLATDPRSGEVAGGDSAKVLVNFNSFSLLDGEYSADVVFATNDPLLPSHPVPATLHVTGLPDIAVYPGSLEFGTIFLGYENTLSVTVRNVGANLLQIASVSVDPPVFTTAATSFDLAPDASMEVVVEFRPVADGPSEGTLTFESNDPDQPQISIPLSGAGLSPPQVALSPPSLGVALESGGATTTPLYVRNDGLSDLVWQLAAEPPTAPAGPTDPPWIRVAMDPPPLEETLANLVLHHEAITSLIPERYDFSEGEEGIRIVNGGDDMYDFGNYLETDLEYYIDYTNGTIAPETAFGPGGRYYTLKVPGLWALAADLDGVEHFSTRGNLGADGEGLVDEALLTSTYSDVTYAGYVKRVFGAGVPSVNHLMIVEDGPSISHEFSTDTGSDYHEVSGLQGSSRLYYLLFAGEAGHYIDDVACTRIMDQFLRLVAPHLWLTFEPTSGTTPAGDSTHVSVSLDAGFLYGGTYEALIEATSNDPATPSLSAPVTLQVTGTPSITVSTDSLDFGLVYSGVTETLSLVVENQGTDALLVEASVQPSEFTTELSNFTVPPGEHRELDIHFLPAAEGEFSGQLTLESNAPSQPTTTVQLIGDSILPPQIAVDPAQFFVSLVGGDSSTETLTLQNVGFSDLSWTVIPAVGEGGSVLSRGPFTGGPASGREVMNGDAFVATSSNDPRFSRILPEAPLEEVLEALDSVSGEITALIPNRFDFSGGVEGAFIDDGGSDMYDRGNYLRTNRTGRWGSLLYRDGTITADTRLGEDGRYFTRKYQGLFVLAADITNLDYFRITGGLGADGDGLVDGSVLQMNVGGISYLGFVKRVWAAGVPSVNHLIIIESSPALAQQFPDDTNLDEHEIQGIYTASRLYYLLYAGTGGSYIDDVATLNIMNAFLTRIGGPVWIGPMPSSGETEPAGSSEVQVTFDAANLLGGEYDARLLIASNDPVAPVVTIATTVSVSQAPSLVISETVLDFGGVPVGGEEARALRVENAGYEQLVVSSITTSSPDCQVVPAQLTLQPGSADSVFVTFAPTVTGPLVSDLILSSNDPINSETAVALTGEGVAPPVAAIDPSSLDLNLDVGESAMEELVLSNSGLSDLTWNVLVRELDTPFPPARRPASLAVAPAPGSAPMRSLPTENLVGVRVLYDATRSTRPLSTYGSLVDNLISRGALVTEGQVPLTLETLAAFDVLWLTDVATPWSQAEMSAVVTWVDGGGSLLLQGGEDPTLAAYNELLDLAGAGMEIADGGRNGLTTAIHPHPSTRGISSIYVYAVRAYLSSVGPPSSVLLEDRDFNPIASVSEVGKGRVAVVTTDFFRNSYIYTSTVRTFANQLFDWMSGAGWLSLQNRQGVVPAGEGQDLGLTVSATDLLGGQYWAEIEILTTDPDAPVLTVPIALDVTGIPDISLSAEALHFGAVFVGGTISRPLRIRNEGTHALNVTDLALDPDDFHVEATSFVVAPRESVTVTVFFTPQGTGPITGELVVSSDDPDESDIAVPLSGEGLPAPDISATPDSLLVALAGGDSVVRHVLVANDGMGDLYWNAFSEYVYSPTDPSTGARTHRPHVARTGIDRTRARPQLGVSPAGEPSHPGDPLAASTPVPWIRLDPNVGVLGPGESIVVDVEFDASEEPAGEYPANVVFASNDPDESEVRISTLLHIIEGPNLTLLPTRVDFGDVFLEYPRVLFLEVRNLGTSALTVESVTAHHPSISASPSELTVPPAQGRIVTVTAAPDALGSVSSQLTLVHDAPDSPTDVPVTLNGAIAPEISLSAEQFIVTVPAGDLQGYDFHVCNHFPSGGQVDASNLRYEVTLQHGLAALDGIHGYLPLGLGEEDPRPSILGSGGPDGFGYSWIDSDAPGGPAFEWVDIRDVGTPAGINGSNDNSGPLPLGFTFPFYGWSFDTVRICTNGWISFLDDGVDGNNQPLPNSGAPSALIAPFWDNLQHQGSDKAFFHNDGSRFIVQYTDVVLATTSDPYTFQVILYPDGKFTYQYLDMDGPTNSATIGIQNPSRTDGLTVVFNQDYVHDEMAIDFTTEPIWLGVEPTTGSASRGTCADCRLTIDARNLDPGYYVGSVLVSSNDPVTPVLPANVIVQVGGLPVTDVVTNLPTVSALHGNAPNPFRPSTHIRFDLPQRAPVSLKIFDVSGRLVRELVGQPMDAGRHAVLWDGRDGGGRRVSSGVYFYRFETGSFRATKRMVLLK